jgi:hypothetical protein
LSADSAGPALLGPLFQILSLGLSAAAVTNYVQSGGAQVDQLDATLHKRLNASLSTFSIAQLSLLVRLTDDGLQCFETFKLHFKLPRPVVHCCTVCRQKQTCRKLGAQ